MGVVALSCAATLSLPLGGAVAGAQPPVVIVAAPLGQGTSCTAGSPCGLSESQSMARRLSGDMDSNIDVVLEGGVYDLTRTLTFDPQDSGTNGFDVVYAAAPGAHPVLSGAVSVTGWHVVDAAKNIWAAPVAPGFDTRQLYADGVRMPRSEGLPSAYYLQTSTGFISSSPVLAG